MALRSRAWAVGIGGAAQNYSTVIGVTTPYMTGGQLFNEYRIGDSIDGRTAENAVGLRNQWHPLEGLGGQCQPGTGASGHRRSDR